MPPTILDLSMLSATLHDDSPNYQLLQQQCYWFAAMLLLVLNADQPEGVLEAETKACPICVECEKVPEEVEQVTENNPTIWRSLRNWRKRTGIRYSSLELIGA